MQLPSSGCVIEVIPMNMGASIQSFSHLQSTPTNSANLSTYAMLLNKATAVSTRWKLHNLLQFYGNRKLGRRAPWAFPLRRYKSEPLGITT